MASSTNDSNLAKKSVLWIPNIVDGFSLATLIGKANPDGLIEVVLMETGEKEKVLLKDCHDANSSKYDKCEDMALLPCLNEASVINTLKQRFSSDLFYTYSGLFCVAINPYKTISMSTELFAEQFKCQQQKDIPPHIFSIANDA